MYVKKVIRLAVSVVPAVLGGKITALAGALLALPLRTHTLAYVGFYVSWC